MSEARDRLERQVDYAEVFARRRSEGILDEQEMGSNLIGTPIARATTTNTAQQRPTNPGPGGGGTNLRRTFGSPISGGIGRNRFLYRTPVLSRENPSAGSSRRSRSRGRNSVLPIWYPRTPLRDITAVVRVNYYFPSYFHIVLLNFSRISSVLPTSLWITWIFDSYCL